MLKFFYKMRFFTLRMLQLASRRNQFRSFSKRIFPQLILKMPSTITLPNIHKMVISTYHNTNKKQVKGLINSWVGLIQVSQMPMVAVLLYLIIQESILKEWVETRILCLNFRWFQETVKFREQKSLNGWDVFHIGCSKLSIIFHYIGAKSSDAFN